MRIPMAFSFFMSAANHNYNAVLHLYSPPAMIVNDIVPTLPPNAVTETNRVTLTRLKHDLVLVEEQLLSAADAYRMYVCNGHDPPFWGYVVESAQVDGPRDILVLMRGNTGLTRGTTLQWMSMSKVFTRKHAYLREKVIDVEGPAEDVMIAMLQLLRDVFEYAVEGNWSYEKRMEFDHAFPFDELITNFLLGFRDGF
mmetsp:Transcript_1190/g.1826  ORF Transcript_1190/g.1826 Transcript_1190/m.1826 type:complete len:197 (+) Transcript_1190:364-954(+)